MDIDGVSEVSTGEHTLSMNGLDNEQKLVSGVLGAKQTDSTSQKETDVRNPK